MKTALRTKIAPLPPNRLYFIQELARMILLPISCLKLSLIEITFGTEKIVVSLPTFSDIQTRITFKNIEF